MKVIKPSYEIWTPISEGGIEELKFIEKVGRVCYRSEDKISEDGESARKFVAGIIKRGHESVLEHGNITVCFTCDRGVSHEIVRHRHCAFSQESTRYCNYGTDKFGGELTFIRPPFFTDKTFDAWVYSCSEAEYTYLDMLKSGASPQEARDVLPASLKTALVMTTNYREWRAFLRLRTAPAAHPQMRELTIPLLREFKSKLPILFDDILEEEHV